MIRSDVTRMSGQFQLGERVKIRNSGDDDGIGEIRGRLTSHERFADGSERWNVRYWHNGELRSVQVEACELEPTE